MKQLTAQEFLSVVWPEPLLKTESLELRIRNRKEKKVFRSFHKSIPEFMREAGKHNDKDIYFGVATRDGKGGKKQNCIRINCVWVDLDGAKSLPKFDKILRPDLYVSSGNGFHIYWLLKKPLYIRGDSFRDIEAVNRALSTKYTGDVMSIDISRVLRVPGFLNHKYGTPREVKAYAL